MRVGVLVCVLADVAVKIAVAFVIGAEITADEEVEKKVWWKDGKTEKRKKGRQRG